MYNYLVSDDTKHIGRECIGFSRPHAQSHGYVDLRRRAGESRGETSQFNVLVAVSNGAEIKPSKLAKILAMDESTLSRNVDRMCAKGLLRLEADEDRRCH
jgi:DNA-binding MarR family transcriptional regulator